jgi:pyridine nucleotide-disulfide oxidoreductase family protein
MSPTRRHLVLLGAGHAHLAVLQAFARHPVEGVDLTLVTPDRSTVYSGMIPGWLAGNYTLDQCRIPVEHLAERSGARLRLQRAVSWDANERSLVISDGTLLTYDMISLDIGSESTWSALPSGPCQWYPVRPIARFAEHWAAYDATPTARSAAVVVVGGGAAGIELALSIRARRLRRGDTGGVTLVTRPAAVLQGHGRDAAGAARHALREAGVWVVKGTAKPAPDGVLLEEGGFIRADAVLLATGARSPQWIRPAGVALSADGFIQVRATHQSTSHADVFAAGDICARDDEGWARSGVHAVHAGPVLAENLQRVLRGQPMAEYRPRRHPLALLASGSEDAIVSWGWLVARGRWAWRWKRWIDERFVRRYAEAA